jgi:hypothetical protein
VLIVELLHGDPFVPHGTPGPMAFCWLNARDPSGKVRGLKAGVLRG